MDPGGDRKQPESGAGLQVRQRNRRDVFDRTSDEKKPGKGQPRQSPPDDAAEIERVIPALMSRLKIVFSVLFVMIIAFFVVRGCIQKRVGTGLKPAPTT